MGVEVLASGHPAAQDLADQCLLIVSEVRLLRERRRSARGKIQALGCGSMRKSEPSAVGNS